MDAAHSFATARDNDASQCTFSPLPFSSGSFRHVSLGTYTRGARVGHPAVVKWFKSRAAAFDERFYDDDVRAVDTALQIVDAWNALVRTDTRLPHVRINRPEVWTDLDGSGRKRLVEPFIRNWQKFNSNSGWTDTDDKRPWARAMQALSHFSYHVTARQLLLCDLQGGVYPDGVVLSDPVVMSRTRRFGVTDLGDVGIAAFFALHTCNEYCSPSWTFPPLSTHNPRQTRTPAPSTVMLSPHGPLAPIRTPVLHYPPHIPARATPQPKRNPQPSYIGYSYSFYDSSEDE